MLSLPDSILSADQQRLFHKIFTEDRPLLDLRAPVEFKEGAFPSSTNLPLMTDDERAQVGTTYKREGKQAAIALGNKLVSGEVREKRIKSWREFCTDHPDGYLYCLRGGLRSRTVSNWLTDASVEYPRIEGGYKALRRYLIDATETIVANSELCIVGGKTGSAKTDFINHWQQSVDLEGLANHRGSSFGRRATPQPKVISFENMVAIQLLKCCAPEGKILLEDEGVTVGSCSIPLALRDAMKKAPVVMLEVSFEERVETILSDYVIQLSNEFIDHDAQDGYENYANNMLSALIRIKKRLGGAAFDEINQLLDHALKTRNPDDHRPWIILLLEKYYDPMYSYQLEMKEHRIAFQGDRNAVTEYLTEQGFTQG